MQTLALIRRGGARLRIRHYQLELIYVCEIEFQLKLSKRYADTNLIFVWI